MELHCFYGFLNGVSFRYVQNPLQNNLLKFKTIHYHY
jgi:hypothetical protein